MHRRNGRGTAVIDVVLPGLGRIRRSSGTTNPRAFLQITALIHQLYETGRHDVLRELRDGRLKGIVLLARHRDGTLDQVTGEGAAPLATMVTWAEHYPGSARWRRDLTAMATRLVSAHPEATVGDLPRLLRAARLAKSKQGHAASFNRERAAVQAFLRDTIGRRSALWQAVADVPTLTETPTRAGAPLSPARLHQLTAALGRHGRTAWDMATTGMGPGEMWGTWVVHPDRVEIRGTKRAARVRVVPKVGTGPVAPAAKHPRTFADALRACDPTVQPYDLRRTYANLLVEAQVPANRRKMYMGHAAGGVTEGYEVPDIRRWLVQDGRALDAMLARALDHAGRRAV